MSCFTFLQSFLNSAFHVLFRALCNVCAFSFPLFEFVFVRSSLLVDAHLEPFWKGPDGTLGVVSREGGLVSRHAGP